MKGWTDILYQQVVGFTFYFTIGSKNLSLASKNKNQPDYSVINVFAWLEQIGRQHDKGPMQQQRNTFGTGIKIIWEKQLADPPIDFILNTLAKEVTRCLRMIKDTNFVVLKYKDSVQQDI